MGETTRPLVDWQTIAAAVPGGVAIQRAGQFVFASDDTEPLLGLAPDALPGEPWERLFVEEDRKRLGDGIRTARANGRWEGEATTSSRLTDGVPVEVTVSAADDDVLVWVFEETTRSESPSSQPPASPTRDGDGTTERLDLYRTILETIEDGVYVLNEDLEFTFVNERTCELLARSREELLGTDVRTLFADEAERDLAEEMRERVLSGDRAGGTLSASIPTEDGERLLESRYRLYPEVGGEFRGSIGVIRDVTEVNRLHRDLRAENRFVQNVVDALEDVLYVVDAYGNFAFWNDVATARFGYTAEELTDLTPIDFIPDSQAARLPGDPLQIENLPDRHRLDLVTKSGETIPHELHGVTYEDRETGETYRVGVARDVTEQLERERELERQRDELATLDRINGLILETVQELLTSANRDAVERTVCERLASSDLYRFAWIGEPELDGDRIVPRVIAGDEQGYLDAVTVTDDDSDTGNGPVGRAIRTGEVQVANVDDPDFAPWRDAARERGVESAIAVPLQNEGTVYGVLAVYAPREDVFSTRERGAFDVLGRTVGFVLSAARSRELLFADEIVELEFSLRTGESMFWNAGVALDCELELAGYVASGEEWVLYVAARDVDPEAVLAHAEDDPTVERTRLINEPAAGGRFEVVVGQSDLLETVSAAGATVTRATSTPDGARLVVEAPIDADVRDVVDIVTREYDGADLLARRERDGEVTTPSRPAGVLGGLTDRQRSVLQAAYRAGYFDWPRESTAEEVAESLSVAPATLHGHLRKAEHAVLSSLFEES